jgi:multiple sugar transport system permease protein
MNGKLKVVAYLGIVIISLWVLLPIAIIAIGSFTPRLELYKWPKTFLPEEFTLSTFLNFAESYGVMNSLWNSILTATITVVLSLFIGAPAGYALARFKFRGKSVFQVGVIVTRMFPAAILSIPLAVTYLYLGLYDTVLGVAYVHTVFAFPFAILISMSIFASVPVEYEEAAMILGCSRPEAFVRVVLPLATPGLAAVAIFSFVISWNEVFAATILTLYNRTLPALIVSRLQAPTLDFLYASALFLIIPALIFIFVVRKQLLRMWGVRVR